MKLICFSCNDTSILSVYSKWLSHSFTFYGPIAFTLKKITEHIWFVTSTQKPEIFRKLRFDISQVWLTFTRTYFILSLLLSCCSNCLSVQLVILRRAWFLQQLSANKSFNTGNCVRKLMFIKQSTIVQENVFNSY